MKELWLKKEECTGCAACANACPKDAINMKKDECGFTQPFIDSKCIDCNICENVCKKRDIGKNSISPKTYAAWSKDETTRFKSTSGGVFTELAKQVIDDNGFVVGAQYNSDNLVEHVMISDELDIDKIRQSKYIQSDIGFIFKEIKIKLKEGHKVAFCGAPCQVAGLNAYLGKKFDNLYTFDFICRGMNSPKAYKSWLEEIEQKENSKVAKVWFKYKQGGWKRSPLCTKIDLENGKQIVLDQDDNLFMKGYLGPNLYIRPVCGQCEFKGTPRQGDITLADFWGLDSKLDDDKGASMVLINNEKGQELFDNIRENLIVFERDFEEIFEGNVCFNSSVKVPKDSEKFLKELDDDIFSEVIKKYTKVSVWKKIKGKVTRLIARIPLF